MKQGAADSIAITYFILIFLLSCLLFVGVSKIATKLNVRYSTVIITSCFLIPYLLVFGEHISQWFLVRYGFNFPASSDCNLYGMHFILRENI